MSHMRFNPWVVRPLTTTINTMVTALIVSIFMAIPAHAVDWVAPAVQVNDPAGTSQDWFRYTSDGQSWLSTEPDGDPFVSTDTQVPTNGLLAIKLYAYHVSGEVREVNLTFTNVSGVSAPNTVTLANRRCVGDVTFYDVYWNQTPDGTGLESYRPWVWTVPDQGASLMQEAKTPVIVPDGQTIRFDTISRYGFVSFSAGWYTVRVGEYTDMAGGGIIEGTPLRWWVPACGNSTPPSGQIPPGGETPGSGSTDPETSSTSATGKLKLLRSIGRVRVQAINRKVTTSTTFKLKRPGIRRALVIKAAAGDVEVRKVKALKSGTFVLKVRVRTNGRWTNKIVARLSVQR